MKGATSWTSAGKKRGDKVLQPAKKGGEIGLLCYEYVIGTGALGAKEEVSVLIPFGDYI